MTRSSVVLPQPDGPMKETNSPSAIARSTFESAIDRAVRRLEGQGQPAYVDDAGAGRRGLAARDRILRHPLQHGSSVAWSSRDPHAAVLSTSAMVPTISSICAFEMMSGGESAMMSPVVRMRTPRSKHSRKTAKVRFVGSPANGSSSIAPTRPRLRMSTTCARAFQRMERVLPIGRELGAAGQKLLVGIGVEGAEPRRAGERMGRIGVAVEELDDVLGPGHEGVVDRALHEDGAHRHDAVGDALRGHHDVGHDAEVVRREGRAEATEAGDDLVEDQQDAVLVADVAQALQIALRRHENAGGTRHRLDDDARRSSKDRAASRCARTRRRIRRRAPARRGRRRCGPDRACGGCGRRRRGACRTSCGSRRCRRPKCRRN